MSERKNYVGVLSATAEPMTLGEFATADSKGCTVALENEHDAGYSVTWMNGRTTWIPKDEFESVFMQVQKSNSVSMMDIARFCNNGFTDKQLDEKTTLVSCETKSGFRMHEVSSCVDPGQLQPRYRRGDW